MPPLGATTHVPPRATMHALPEQPCMPPLGATMYAPLGATMHTPRATTHAPPGATMHAPPCGQTDTCKNITFANFVCGQ